jgi:hypothetical protein
MVWEYQTTVINDPHLTFKEQLNWYGKDGWELVAISAYRKGGSKWFIFKRPKLLTSTECACIQTKDNKQ